MNTITRQLTLLCTLLFSVPLAWADRVLIDDIDQHVNLNGELDCYGTADITIDTVRPELFEPGSDQLQRLADAVRAILNYECPELSAINLHGILRGLQEPVYSGQLLRQDNWIVKTLPQPAPGPQAILSEAEPELRFELPDTLELRRTDASLPLVHIHLGMEVDQVSRIITDQLKATPSYDQRLGLMSLNLRGCPPEFDIEIHRADVQADWKCLRAKFSDRRIARLEQLEFTQVARGDIESVYQALLDQYGTPYNSPAELLLDSAELTWQTGTNQTLQATLHELDIHHTVTELKLLRNDIPQTGLSLTTLDSSL